MAKNNKRRHDRRLEDEARSYVSGLPDETAAGRLVDDEGSPVRGWRADSNLPQDMEPPEMEQDGASTKSDPDARRGKRGSQDR